MDNDIESLFREKLKDYEKEPPSNVWENIHDEYTAGQKYKILSFKVLAYAASVVLLAGLTVIFFMKNPGYGPSEISLDKNEKRPVVLPEEHKNPEINQQASLSAERSNDTASNNSGLKKQKGSVKSSSQVKLITVNSGAETKEIVLPDSSKVYLNGFSEIVYQQSFKEKREITLKGEAYFDVKSNKSRPFIIHCSNSVTHITGTSFLLRSVEQDADEIYVTSGTVIFKTGTQTNGEQSVIVEAGHRASTLHMKASKFTDNNLLAWKEQQIEFENTPMPQVCSTLEKYFRVNIELTGHAIKSCRFTGSFEDPTIEGILDLMHTTSGISYIRKDNRYILSGKGCR
jgi:hypothetical protein